MGIRQIGIGQVGIAKSVLPSRHLAKSARRVESTACQSWQQFFFETRNEPR
jgi:hypothetical protein